MKKFLVWGLGKSGVSALRLLRSKGYIVFSGDDARKDRWEDYLGEVDAVVLSPGIPPAHPLWKEALRRDVEVMGELELAARFFRGRILAVTGTDGKSTTTRLIYTMLSSCTSSVFEAGNTGTPFSGVVHDHEEGIAVLEVSSFQGKTLSTMKPSLGVFLNFAEDHLDWHPSLRDYLESKWRIFRLQSAEDLLIIDGSYRELTDTPSEARKIDIRREVRIGSEGVVYRKEVLFRLSDLKLRGEHNLRNAVFASLAAYHFGVPPAEIARAIREFRGLPFRMELVGRFRGVEIYNDSKATTPNALKSALASFPDYSVILIAGGKDKGADFSSLTETVSRKVKLALLIGETKEKMKSVFGGSTEVQTCDDLSSALERALSAAKAGDFILFSPGCSSFDMFSSYVERGRIFNRLVMERAGGIVNY